MNMADINQGGRPLSPHLTIYRPQLNSAMSIFHRITGAGLAFAAVLGVCWFIAAASSESYFKAIDGLLTSWIGGLIMLLSLVGLSYHFCNGVRHLVWDAGFGFDLDALERSSFWVFAGTIILTLITLNVAFC
jgi:succinate dehydrogenase / fumarate reductase cytochrome b subunit